MIDNRNLLNIVARELQEMQDKATIKLLTYKKDRAGFSIIEDSYRKVVWTDLNEHEVIKRLKKLQKIEFPRSNKLYLERKKQVE